MARRDQVRKTPKKRKTPVMKEHLYSKNGVYRVHRNDADIFEEDSRKEGKSLIPIMTFDDYIIYLKVDAPEVPTMPSIVSSKLDYDSGKFEKKWGPDHDTLELTPDQSEIGKVEIEIHGLDARKVQLLPDRRGDVIEDVVRIKITRHYRFSDSDPQSSGVSA